MTRGSNREPREAHDIWIDFNTIQDGVVRTLRKFAASHVDVKPGLRVIVGDDEGTTATATVESIGANGMLTLRVDASTVVSQEPADVIRLTS